MSHTCVTFKVGIQDSLFNKDGIQDSNLNLRKKAGIQDSNLVFKGPIKGLSRFYVLSNLVDSICKTCVSFKKKKEKEKIEQKIKQNKTSSIHFTLWSYTIEGNVPGGLILQHKCLVKIPCYSRMGSFLTPQHFTFFV